MAENMEMLRMVSNLYAAFPATAGAEFEDAVMVMKTPDLVASFMVKPAGFTRAEIKSVRRFQKKNGIDPVYTPGKTLSNVVEKFIRTPNKSVFIEDFPRNISPTSDDKPYFFNFTRWSDPWGSRKYATSSIACPRAIPSSFWFNCWWAAY
jgi:hypothetical protein